MRFRKPNKETSVMMVTSLVGCLVTFSLLSYQDSTAPPPPEILNIQSADILNNEEKRFSGVVVIEYMDYECPPCKNKFLEIEKLKTEYKNKVLFSIRHFPMDFHKYAKKLAILSEIYRLQGNLSMHDFLMKCENFDNSNYQNIKKTILGDKINKKHVRTANDIVNKDVALGALLHNGLAVNFTR